MNYVPDRAMPVITTTCVIKSWWFCDYLKPYSCMVALGLWLLGLWLLGLWLLGLWLLGLWLHLTHYLASKQDECNTLQVWSLWPPYRCCMQITHSGYLWPGNRNCDQRGAPPASILRALSWNTSMSSLPVLCIDFLGQSKSEVTRELTYCVPPLRR